MISKLICFYTLSALVFGQDLPQSPCPDVFQYQQEATGDVYGSITLPYDGSSSLHLGVNASMRGYYTDNRRVKLKIKMNTLDEDLAERRTNNLNYGLYFPFQNAIPKITRIMYNNREYCTGPPEELLPGTAGVTSLWAGHNYFFQAPGISQNSIVPSSGQSPDIHISDNNKQSFSGYPPVPTLDLRPKVHNVECGVISNLVVPLIVGGRDIENGMFPWLAAMFTGTGTGYQYKCTANVISDRHVVTAARCVSFFKLQVVKVDDILLIFGRRDLRHWATSGAVIRGASAINTNPEFDTNSGHGDITVITLNQPLDFSSTISPICLWEGDDNINNVVDQTGTVAGWGADEAAQDGSKSSISLAKAVDMPIVSKETCLFSNFTYLKLTSDSTFCAGVRDGSSGVCVGDSGAGFFLKENGKFYLRGLASLILTEKGRCDVMNYMVFSDVAKWAPWIRSVVIAN